MIFLCIMESWLIFRFSILVFRDVEPNPFFYYSNKYILKLSLCHGSKIATNEQLQTISVIMLKKHSTIHISNSNLAVGAPQLGKKLPKIP